MHTFQTYFKKHRFTAIFFLLVLGALFWFFFLQGAPPSPHQTVVAASDELVQEVSVTGKVKAIASAELSFSVGGRIASVPVRVGDTVGRGAVLVTLENGDVAAKLEQSLASLRGTEAKLNELIRGIRPEEIAVTEAKVASARQALVDDLQTASASADAAIQVDLDQFISNPNGTSPQLSFSTSDSALENAVESGRVAIGAPLKTWREHASLLTASNDLTTASIEAQKVLQQASSLLATAAAALNRAIPGSAVTQATIDGYAADIAAARSSVASSISSVSAASTALTTVEATLALEKAGTDPQVIAAQQATVAAAAAVVNADKATLAKTVLVAPFGGVVTHQDAKVGQVVGQSGSSASLVTLMSSQGFEIETFVPEADIAKISVGDEARVTLDAYGDDVAFGAVVSFADPAETVIEGVSTYKVILAFTEEPMPVRSGMTANVEVKTASREGVIAVPSRAVSDRSGTKTVLVLLSDGTTEERIVTTGLQGSDGRVELTSGVQAGEKIVIYSAE
ncbi:MAG: efflux RND transporter periplasmic adaptor subunit [Patescibacteria group bacterium]